MEVVIKSIGAQVIENHENLSGADAIKENNLLVQGLNDTDALETLKTLMSGPRSVIGSAVSGTNELWERTIENFRQRVVVDNQSIAGHEVAGHTVLYNQLAYAYELGLMLVQGHVIHPNQPIQYRELGMLLYRHHLKDEKENLEKGKFRNIWTYVTKLLYGKWIKIDDLDDKQKRKLARKLKLDTTNLLEFAENDNADWDKKTVFHAWEHDRSAEKYACVFRFLQNHDVQPSDAAKFIENFSDKDHGTKLAGIESKDRTDNRQNSTPKPLSENAIKQRDEYKARGENPANGDVIELDKPDKLPDTVQFGRAMFKVVGKKLVIVGYDALEQGAYDKHVIARGKSMIEAEKIALEQHQATEKKLDGAAMDLGRALYQKLFDKHREQVSSMLAAGLNSDEIAEKLLGQLGMIEVVQNNTNHLQHFADPE